MHVGKVDGLEFFNRGDLLKQMSEGKTEVGGICKDWELKGTITDENSVPKLPRRRFLYIFQGALDNTPRNRFDHPQNGLDSTPIFEGWVYLGSFSQNSVSVPGYPLLPYTVAQAEPTVRALNARLRLVRLRWHALNREVARFVPFEQRYKGIKMKG